MKGFLSFLILWLLKKKKMNGADISSEIETRKGNRPSPGTIYPVLKELKDKKLISTDKNKFYSLTSKGKKELDTLIEYFLKTFPDVDDMKKCCGK
jgi:DNA-binding PadR family transcriptional regulator